MPKTEKNISMSVIRRLPRYYRFLSQLIAQGIVRVSSKELSEKMGLTASQIRQDLNCFGGFGQQGYGYVVEQLHDEIGNILGLSQGYKAILVGAGNLGSAVASHMSFKNLGFQLLGIFDNDPQKIGQDINQVPILNIDTMETFSQKEKAEMAILCIPRSAVEEVVKRLYKLGIKTFWNFSHYDIAMNYPDTTTENVHLNDSLMTLCYRISNHKEED